MVRMCVVSEAFEERRGELLVAEDLHPIPVSRGWLATIVERRS